MRTTLKTSVFQGVYLPLEETQTVPVQKLARYKNFNPREWKKDRNPEEEDPRPKERGSPVYELDACSNSVKKYINKYLKILKNF